MKKNTSFPIYSRFRVANFRRVFKQTIFSPRLHSIMTGLLIMLMAITTPALEEVIISDQDRAQRIPVEGLHWKDLFSQMGKEDLSSDPSLSELKNELLTSPRQQFDLMNAYTDLKINEKVFARLIAGTSINFSDDSGKPAVSLSTLYFGSQYFNAMLTGQFYDEARPLLIDAALLDSITNKPPGRYVGLKTEIRYQIHDADSYDEPDPNLQEALDTFYYYYKHIKAGSTPGEITFGWAPSVLSSEVFELNNLPSFGDEISDLEDEHALGDLIDSPPVLNEEWVNNLSRKMFEAENKSSSANDSIVWHTLVAWYEGNFWRTAQETDPVVPNDPLFAKEESKVKKAASGLTKAFGSVLKLGGSGITVGESPGEKTKPPNQWGLLKVGYTPHSDPRSAWNIEDGSRKNVVVAVIDSGLDLKHVDGPKYLWTNAGEIPGNKIDDDGNGYVDDIHGWNFVEENHNLTDDFGHGTFVTGIIAAKTNNGEGIAGINPGAQIMTLKALSKKNKASSLAIYRAIRYAVDNGARVINISLGSKGISRLEQIGINYAYAQDCLVVISSGNQGGDVAEYGPQGARRAFSVAAVNVDGKRRGSANHGSNVAMTAPGEHIYSLTAKDGKKDGQITPVLGTKYHTLTGTSFSAPMVAGTASLIWAKNPNLTNREVEDLLLDSAEDLGRKGWDRYNGAGLLNAGRALGGREGDRLTVRFSEVFANTEKKKIASLDVYGVIRGNLDSYVVELGKGKKPDKWKQVFGPSVESAEFNHICRIENELLQKGREWTVRITAKSKSGKIKTASLYVKKKKN